MTQSTACGVNGGNESDTRHQKQLEKKSPSPAASEQTESGEFQPVEQRRPQPFETVRKFDERKKPDGNIGNAFIFQPEIKRAENQ